MALTQVTSIGLKDGEIVNADLHSAAAIVLSKLNTTGTASSSTFLRGDGAWTAIDLSNLNASNLTSGTVGTARLGSGTASSSTFLRGDGSWQTMSADGGNAATLDSIDSSQFLRSDANDTYTGTLSLAGVIKGSDTYPLVQVYSSKAYFGSTSRATQIATNSSTGITANVSGTAHVMWHAGNDGSGSGLDADTLDGRDSNTGSVANTIALRDSSSNLTGAGFISTGGTTDGLVGLAYSTNYFGLKTSSQTLSSEYMIISANADTYISANSGYNVNIRPGGNSSTNQLTVSTSGTTIGGNTVWHAGNDGSGSGLDADTLDGVQGSSFLRSDAADSATGTLTVRDILFSSGYTLQRSSHQSGHLEGGHNNIGGTSQKTSPIYTIGSSYNPGESGLSNMYGLGFSHTDASFISATGSSGWGAYVAADGDARVFLCGSNGGIWSTNQHYVGSNVVWNAGNDGSGSGLDADQLDGVQANKFFTSYNNAGTTGWEDSNANFRINGGASGSVGLAMHTSNGTFGYQIYGSGGTTYGFLNANWGGWDLKKVINGQLQLRIGGTDYTVWNQQNDGSGSGLDADTLDGVQGSSYLRSDAADSATGTLTVRDVKLSAGYHLQRSDHHSGHLEGSYNNIGANSYKSNPIYSIGSSYNPGDAALSNFYGIGYSHNNASFIGSSLSSGSNGWGMYVAADGDARIWLNGSHGTIQSTGQHYVSNTLVWNAGNDGSGSGLDADLWDGDQKSTYLNQAVLTSSNVTHNNIYSNSWFRNNDSGEGLYNESSTQHFYSDHDDIWNMGGGTTGNFIRFRDENAGTVRGYVGTNNSSACGFLDYEGNWSFATGKFTNYSYRDLACSPDGNHDLGYGNRRWDNVYATNGTIQTSDRNEKENIVATDLGLDFVNKLSPVSFKRKGKTRTHYGFIAQDIEQIITDLGKTTTQFAPLIKSDISEAKDGSEYRYGLRYEQLLAPVVKAIQELAVKVAALESA